MVIYSDSYYDEVNKKLYRKVAEQAGKAIRRGLMSILRSLGPVIVFKLIAIGLIFLLFIIAYTCVFLVPQQIIMESIRGKGVNNGAVSETIPYGDLFAKYGNKYNINPLLLAAIASIESNFDIYLDSPISSATGMMQIITSTGKYYGMKVLNRVRGEDERYDPDKSIDVAARIIRNGLNNNNNNMEKAITSYRGLYSPKYLKAVFKKQIEFQDYGYNVGNGRMICLFNVGNKSISAWGVEDDEKLYAKYLELTCSWGEGLTEFQQEQIQEYALPWAILAAIDRTVGDPSVNPEAKIKEITPQPEKHYKILKPKFAWKKSTITQVTNWTETLEDGTKKERKNVDTKEVMLLVSAKTYEANYQYEYEKKTEQSSVNGKNITTTRESVNAVNVSGPYYEPLKQILNEHKLGKKTELNLEYVLELASVYDEEFNYNLKEKSSIYNPQYSEDNIYPDYQGDGTLKNPCWPLPSKFKKITSPFGYRIHPILKTKRFHNGIDIDTGTGDPIYAIADGCVVKGKGDYDKVNGNYVVISHGGSMYSCYCHLVKAKAKKGEIVKAGDVIGYSGSTGWSTGDHLHFGIKKVKSGKTQFLNPLSFYK